MRGSSSLASNLSTTSSKTLDYIPDFPLNFYNLWIIIQSMSNIWRKEFFDRLLLYKDKHIIKVITGVRRCGKSTLLEMFKEYLLKNGVGENQIISLNAGIPAILCK